MFTGAGAILMTLTLSGFGHTPREEKAYQKMLYFVDEKFTFIDIDFDTNVS